MMGGETPETCWAVNKRHDNKLENCCVWLVIYLICNFYSTSQWLDNLRVDVPNSMLTSTKWCRSTNKHSSGCKDTKLHVYTGALLTELPAYFVFINALNVSFLGNVDERHFSQRSMQTILELRYYFTFTPPPSHNHCNYHCRGEVGIISITAITVKEQKWIQ
jgi:hypothetical protein